MTMNAKSRRSPKSLKIITALADGPRDIGELCQLTDCSWMGVSSATRALHADGTIARVRKLDRPDQFKLRENA